MEFKFNVNEINSKYDFNITGVSYIGKPVSNTAMYISKKVESLIDNLEKCKGCLVYTEEGINVPSKILNNNLIVFTNNPQGDYAKFVNILDIKIKDNNKKRKYLLTDDGYYIGENVKIGNNAYIEPLAFIDHDVVIGNNAYIKAGATIRNSTIGDNFIAGERCTIGTYGFTMADDENGNKFRIPTLGKVIIGNNVEIGSLTDVSCGSAGNTIIEDNVKIDAIIHIGHDSYIMKNAELAAGSNTGGFGEVGEKTFMGINSSLRNRKRIGANSFICMGAVVMKDIPDNVIAMGNPARPMVKR